VELGPVTADDVDAAGQLLATSFADDPAPVWWWPDPAARAEFAPKFFTANARLALALGDGLMTSAGDAVALYLPPGTAITEDDVVAAGVPAVLGELGAETAENIGRFLGSMSGLHGEVMPEPHWQLFFLGVHPSMQGKGLGTELVNAVHERALSGGVGVYLDTLTADNVAYYERRGYRVIGEIDVPDSPIHVWAMRFN
jgi:GNAT superfamily N-acetyltransferase